MKKKNILEKLTLTIFFTQNKTFFLDFQVNNQISNIQMQETKERNNSIDLY